MKDSKKKYNLYTESERMCYIREYLCSEENKSQFCKRAGICPKLLNYWLTKYQMEDKSIYLCNKSPEGGGADSSLGELQRELSLLRLENQKLQRELAEESLRHEACETLIDLAESTYHIKVRKNSAAK